MKIERVAPPPPPREFALTFTRDEGWAIVGALKEYAVSHRGAVHADTWSRWADELDAKLREGA